MSASGGGNRAGSAAEHIYSESYKAKLREKFVECMEGGQDLSIDCDGNLMLLETKPVFQSLIWNPATCSFEKAYGSRSRKSSGSGRRKSGEVVSQALGAAQDKGVVGDQVCGDLEEKEEV